MSQKYAAYDSTGAITGFYDSEDSPVPKGVQALAITDSEWQEAISNQGYSVSGGKLVPPSSAVLLERAKLSQKASINSSCQQAIVSGFTSNALGASYRYKSGRDDQLNLMGAAQSGMDMPFKCQDVSTGKWAYVAHTAAQLKQVFSDGAAYKISLLQKADSLNTQIDDAADVATVQVITW